MKVLFLLLYVLTGYKIYSQDTSTVHVHLFSEGQSSMSLMYEYEISAEGDNAVGKTIFSNVFRVSKGPTRDGLTEFYFEADSTRISNSETMQDGEARLLYAMIGLKMNVKCDPQGQLAEIMNKEEILNELKAGISGFSEEQKEQMIQAWVGENEKMLFDKLFELNYSPLMKYENMQVLVPFENRQDSSVDATHETPASFSTIRDVHTKMTNEILLETIVSSRNDAYIVEMESGYQIDYKPVVSNSHQKVIASPNGEFRSLSIHAETRMEGMVMRLNGNAMDEPSPFTTRTRIEMIRLRQ